MITIAIPTWNSAGSIKQVVSRLHIQGVPLQVKIYDNMSEDGTPELVKKLIEINAFRFPVEVLIKQKMTEGLPGNLPYLRYLLCQDTETEYIFHLDSDVILPPNTIFDCLEFMNENPDMGCVAVMYEPLAGHIQIGASLMKTETAKKLEWRYVPGKCECWFIKEQIEKMNLKIQYHPRLTAYHMKYV